MPDRETTEAKRDRLWREANKRAFDLTSGGSLTGLNFGQGENKVVSLLDACAAEIDGLRAERVTYLGPVERDAHCALGARPVIGDVAEVEPVDRPPLGRIKRL